MPIHRRRHVWLPGSGWVQKRDTVARNYDELCNESWAFLISFWRWYPDQMLDVLRSENAKYPNEELIQRVMLRAFARYDYVDITGCRSLTKTNTVFKSKLTANVLWPGTSTSYYGPGKENQAKLAGTAYRDIEASYPALTEHYKTDSMGKTDFGVSTDYGSSITINGIRGDTVHNVVAEEYAKEERPNPFNVEEYSAIILYAIRGTHIVKGEVDPTYIPYQQLSITSAGRRQNHSYETRTRHLAIMRAGCGESGEKAFVMDVPWQVVVLSKIRPYRWVIGRKNDPNTTPDKWMREMESHYTGSDTNPIVRDEMLTESRQLVMMENHHCCFDRDNRIKPEDVIYVVGFDVAYRDGKENAKCAVVVLKCTKQNDWLRRDKYLKEVVWVEDWRPSDTPTPMAMARKVKKIWHRYCFEGSETYISMDSWQFGESVMIAMFEDMGDGILPLCTYQHAQHTELEREHAIPVIYPIKAGGVGTTDPDSEIVLNAEMQFEHGNIRLLTSNVAGGIEAFKKYHRIKDDSLDYAISIPYKKTNELVNQIQNLREVPSGAGVSEKRISPHIQRDSWSALKYALRFAQKLERTNLVQQTKKSDYDELLKAYQGMDALSTAGGFGNSRLITARQGGRFL